MSFFPVQSCVLVSLLWLNLPRRWRLALELKAVKVINLGCLLQFTLASATSPHLIGGAFENCIFPSRSMGVKVIPSKEEILKKL